MGLFTNSKLSALDKAINLLSERLGEFAEFESPTLHHSVANMFSSLFDDVFKLYYPNQNALGTERIRVASKQPGGTVSHVMPVNYWIAALFRMGLVLEGQYRVTIFKDQAQRSFATSLNSNWL